MDQSIGSVTVACRSICSILVILPLLYWSFMEDGSAYQFLALLLLAPIAGLILFANSIFCLFRYRNWKSVCSSLGFISISLISVLTAWHFLPKFRM